MYSTIRLKRSLANMIRDLAAYERKSTQELLVDMVDSYIKKYPPESIESWVYRTNFIREEKKHE